MKKITKHFNSLKKTHRDWLILTAIFTFATIVLYSFIWFFMPGKLEVVYQNWDGPVYAVIAKTAYNPQQITNLGWSNFKEPFDYASSFPLYPLFIRIFSFIGLFRAMILVSVLSSLGCIIAFYELVKKYQFSANPLLLSTIFIFLPPRWFISSHIGSSEPLFILFIILSLNYFLGKKYFLSAMFLFFAQLTRSQGILFFAGFGFALLVPIIKNHKLDIYSKFKEFISKFIYYLLGPIALLIVFSLFYIQYGNFFAFFTAMSKWHQMANYPFEVFASYPRQIVPTFWLEDHYWTYFFDVATILLLFRKKLDSLAYIAILYFIPLTFVIHIDISRYNLPLVPLSLIAIDSKASTKLILIATLILLPALLLYSANFMLWNR